MEHIDMTDTDPLKLEENVDYEFIPIEDQDHWHVRIKTGEFIETVFEFGTLKVSDDGEHLNFDFNLIYSPDDDLNVENNDLQLYAGSVLSNILENSVGQIQE